MISDIPYNMVNYVYNANLKIWLKEEFFMSSSFTLKLVTTPNYHLWTDALHARALAEQANNDWDRGTYIRWTITTAWTCFEICCEHALEIDGLGNRFKDRLNQGYELKSLPKPDWGQGLWQQVLNVYSYRKKYVHEVSSQKELFPELSLANNTIQILRNAIKQVYMDSEKEVPSWINDDSDRGWDSGSDPFAHGMAIHNGANENDPNCIKIAYIYKGKEYISSVYPPGADPKSIAENLIRRIKIPISAIRLYCGSDVIKEIPLPARGSN